MPALRAGTLLLTGLRCRNWDGSGESLLAAMGGCRRDVQRRARLGVADVGFDVMLSLAAGDASGVGVSETLLALEPARRNRVRSGKAARLYGLRRLADAATPAA